jgi:dephospho-CoA kinase
MGLNRPLLIGLTGGIGTGKSTLGELFRQHGARLISADQLSRELLAPDGEGTKLLRRQFGERFFSSGGVIDRGGLRRAIFADPELRRKLDSLLHPLIRKRIFELLAETGQNMPEAIRPPFFQGTVVEVPLLFEAGWQDDFDRVVVVLAEDEQALERLRQRDGVSRAEAEAAVAAQMPLCEKIARADYVIDNRGSLDETARQVSELIVLLRDGQTSPA